ncbi:MAG: hypothetical protein ACT4RN_00860 [Pseudonocardia sp.]
MTPTCVGGASYRTHVAMTGESTFDETGEIAFDGGGRRRSTVGAGVIERPWRRACDVAR